MAVSKEQCRAIFKEMLKGTTIKEACLEFKVNRGAFWMAVNSDDSLLEEFYVAKRGLCQVMADEIIELADRPIEKEGMDLKYSMAQVHHRRLQVDTRKWLLSKVLPKMYGDRIDLNSKQEIEVVE